MVEQRKPKKFKFVEPDSRERIAHRFLREKKMPVTKRMAARARAMRAARGMTTTDIVSCAHPYWAKGSGVASFETSGKPTSELGLLFYADRLALHPAMMMLQRPSYIKEWDTTLNQLLFVYEQTPDGSRECQTMMNDLQAATENAMGYFQKREERRAAAVESEKEELSDDMVEDFRAYFRQQDEMRAELKKKYNIDL